MNGTEDRAGKINATQQVFVLQVGHKRFEDEVLYRFIIVRGNDCYDRMSD